MKLMCSTNHRRRRGEGGGGKKEVGDRGAKYKHEGQG